MPEEEFWDTTWRSLYNRIEGYFEIENKKEQANWERVRWQSALILQMFAKKGKKVKLKDVAVFPWEQESTPKPPPGRKLTPEEQREKFAQIDAQMRKKWQRTS
jgi:hypothetical protein